MKRNRQILYLLGLILVILYLAFSYKKNPSNTNTNLNIPAEIQQPQKVKNVRNIFYNIPSPIEVTDIIKQMNIPYYPDLMNCISNADNYLTQSDIALNIGVYSADLCYIRIYEQYQDAAKYFSIIKRLNRELGIPEGHEEITTQRLESNLQNPDSLIQIITETFALSNSYLKENARGGTAALIILGGWIETLYLATNIMNHTESKPELTDLILQQKHSIKNLIGLLGQFSHEEKISQLLPALKHLEHKFQQVQSSRSSKKGIIKERGKTVIKNKVENYASPNLLKEIREINNSLREQLISI